jgi:hypothetical protein
MPKAERLTALQALEAARGTDVIAYVTSTRPGLDVSMAMDVIPIVYEHLRALPPVEGERKIDLFLHSNGGDGVVPWRLVTLIREFCSEFTVIVPHHAYSAATLTALGADKVIMHAMGMLGPTDPTASNPFSPRDEQNPTQILGISVEDVASYFALVKDDVGVRHDDGYIQALRTLTDRVHPLALGNVKRITSQSRMLGEKLLRLRNAEDLDEHDITEVIKKLSAELFYHGHPINRVEARDELGLSFVEDAAGPISDRIWELYEAFDADMHLSTAFQALFEAMAIGPLPNRPNPGQQVNVSAVPLPTLNGVYVQSTSRSDVFEIDYEVTLRRDWTGSLEGHIGIMRQGWIAEP